MGHPVGLRLTLVEEAARLADDLLRPVAEEVDRSRVPRSHLDALAAAGLLDLLESSREDVRLIREHLAGACLATWFVLAQHVSALSELARSSSPSRELLLEPMRSGTVLSGIAFAHLRRPVSPVTCRRAEGGWSVSGHVPWMTSWGLADVFLLGARSDHDLVFAMVPARAAPGLVPSEPLSLLAMQATSTVTLELASFFVADDSVVAVTSFTAWSAADRDRTADVSPDVVGLQREVVRLLQAKAPELARRLGEEGDVMRSEAYALIGVADRYDDRLQLRATWLDLLMRTATALVVATGGSAMDLASPAQRHLREAAFLQVQAQTPALRALMAELA